MNNEQWTMSYELWTMKYEQWTMNNEQWKMNNKQWTMKNGTQTTDIALRRMGGSAYSNIELNILWKSKSGCETKKNTIFVLV